jgi:hypothetical protein
MQIVENIMLKMSGNSFFFTWFKIELWPEPCIQKGFNFKCVILFYIKKKKIIRNRFIFGAYKYSLQNILIWVGSHVHFIIQFVVLKSTKNCIDNSLLQNVFFLF